MDKQLPPLPPKAKPKRKGYGTKLRADLKLAQDRKLHPAIIKDLEDRLAAHKAYKHTYYKAHYVPRGAGDGQS
jgi:hypothetical protein